MKEHDPENPGWKLRRPFGDPRRVRCVTFSCVDRLPLFHREETRDAFVFALLAAAAAERFWLWAWVVMPEHVHLLASERTYALLKELGSLKGRFAYGTFRRWERERPAAAAALTRPDGTRRFWLPGEGYDRSMRSEDDCREKCEYLHANPVRRGLARLPRDYRWCSAGWPDWCAQAGYPDPPRR